MLTRTLFWLNNSRLFSVPMTFMSWLVIFVYSRFEGGNVINGVLALIGITMAHLATNLFDDYVDYKTLCQNDLFMDNIVKNKCAYIKSGQATLNELLGVVCVYCLIASSVGLLLLIRCGWNVLWLALIGGVLTLSYSFLSMRGLSEFAVGIAFGPLFFEGVYFVMCGRFSMTVFLLSLVIVVFTIGLMYVNTLLDFDGDACVNKKTLCCRIGDKFKAAKFLLVLYGIGYTSCLIMAGGSQKVIYALPLVTMPLAIELYFSIQKFNEDKMGVVKPNWWNFPLENWRKIEADGTANFYFRIYQARNLMVWVSICMLMAIIFINL